MRRLLAIAITLAAAGAAAAFVFGSSAQGSSDSRFDVIFDDARGLVGGQQVKIAGARAGRIENVIVTPDFKARIEATVDSRFIPFHRDATCTIRPEGLIAENYVDCDPGSANAPELKAGGSHPPTVPVTNTTEPVSLLDLFNIFNLPTRQRLMVIVDELGIGTSARGTDFNAILRRANPALALARQAISILARQKAQLGTIVDATNTIAAEGAGHTANLQTFLDRAAALSTRTAAHSGSLSLAINRLPGLLAAAQPALAQLDVVARDGTPLLGQVNTAVPYLNRVSHDLGPFVAAAQPGLTSLRKALKQAIPAIQATTPVVGILRRYTHRSLPGTRLLAKLSANLQRRGFVEGFLSVTYYIGASLSRFDSVSHMLPIFLVGPNNGMCGSYSTKPVPGCQATFTGPPYRPVHSSASDTTRPSGAQAPSPTGVSQGNPAPAQAGPPGAPSQSPSPSRSPAGGSAPTSSASSSAAPPGPGSPGGPNTTVPQSSQNLRNLANYLFK
jgi:phospholipid/cholesterol/gamma-HCH transport system substrate-binding protein